jgi:O-antigen/teichoic acid export membrane protein
MLKSTLKGLFSHSLIYSLAWISSSAASILLLPVYTRYLTKTDYGILEILSYTNAILRILMIAGFHSSLAKFFHEQDSDEWKKKVMSTGTIFVAVAGLTGCLLATFCNDTLSLLLLGEREYTDYVNVSIAILYADLLVTISTTYFVVSKKPKIYVVYSMGRLILAIASNLYFIIVLELGAMGMLLGNMVSMLLGAMVLTIHNLFANGLRVDFTLLRRMLKFGVPMIPAMLSASVMHNADRFLVRHFCSLADVGLYGLGYRFPFMLNALVLDSFNRVWTGSTMYEISKRPDAKYQFSLITTYFIACYVFLQLCLSILSEPIVRLLAAPKFFSAHEVVPIVALGLCFHAFYTFFTAGTFLKSKTWLLNLSYIPAAVINIIGNIILLPRYGFMAAAWMTVVTYFVFAVIAFLTCRKLLNISFEILRLVAVFVVAVVVFLLSSLLSFDNILFEVAKDIVFIAFFPLTLAFGGWLSKDERVFVLDKLAAFKRQKIN